MTVYYSEQSRFQAALILVILEKILSIKKWWSMFWLSLCFSEPLLIPSYCLNIQLMTISLGGWQTFACFGETDIWASHVLFIDNTHVKIEASVTGMYFIWKRNDIVSFSPPVHTKTMKTTMKAQAFEYVIQIGSIWKRNSMRTRLRNPGMRFDFLMFQCSF